MFTMINKINKQGVMSDKGFSVKSIDQYTIQYSDAEGTIDLMVERGQRIKTGKCLVYVCDYEFEQWNDGTSISEEKRLEIIKNFIDGMDFMGIDVEID